MNDVVCTLYEGEAAIAVLSFAMEKLCSFPMEFLYPFDVENLYSFAMEILCSFPMESSKVLVEGLLPVILSVEFLYSFPVESLYPFPWNNQTIQPSVPGLAKLFHFPALHQ